MCETIIMLIQPSISKSTPASQICTDKNASIFLKDNLVKPYILIAEDEDALATLLEYNFQKEGYEVGVARDGDEVLVMADERTPDLILMDWMMPKLSGVEAL